MKLIAHGGFSAEYPENTLASYLAAEKFNPFAIEMDVILDPERKKLVCHHPHGIAAPDGSYSPEVITKDLPTEFQFPSFKEVLELLKSDTRIVVDLKEQDIDGFDILLANFSEQVHRLILGIRTLENLKLARNRNTKVKTLALYNNSNDYVSFRKEGGSYYRLWEKDINKELIDAIHKTGLEVWVTPGLRRTQTQQRTAGEISQQKLLELLNIGVDAVLVNDIKHAAKWLSIVK